MSHIIEIQPPNEIKKIDGYATIFLGGSIEMGKAIDFQRMVIDSVGNKPYIFYNPRRSDWGSSWVQSKDNPNFRGQVEWELNALEEADVILMYFDPNTKSPISLMELGLFASSGKMIVCCPEGFWRKGNVDIVCEKYGIKQVDTLEDLIQVFNTGELDDMMICNGN